MNNLKFGAITIVSMVAAYAEPVGVLVQDNGMLSGYGIIGQAEPPAAAPLSITLVAQPEPQPVVAPVVEPIVLSRTTIEALPSLSAPEPTAPAVVQSKRHTWVEPALPKNLLRPDANGAILITRGGSSAANVQQQNPRNPWGIRVTTKASVTEYAVRLEGIMVGPNPTALINGIPLQRGERQIGPFTLAIIRKNDVVMEFDGIYFLVPDGQLVTVRIPKI